jgi:hypothetical protein
MDAFKPSASGTDGRPAAPSPGTAAAAATAVDTSALISGVVRLITTHPGLLLEHAQAHAGLLALDLAASAARAKRQALWWAIALCSGLVGLMLAGVALMLWLTRSLPLNPLMDATQTAWLLACVPAVPLLLAAVSAAGGLGLFDARVPSSPGPMARLQDDLALLRANAR